MTCLRATLEPIGPVGVTGVKRRSEQLTDAEKQLRPAAPAPTAAEECGTDQRIQVEASRHIVVEIGRAEALKGTAVFQHKERVAIAAEIGRQVADPVQV